MANIKRKSDAVATELAARKENVDPSEGEPFVRGVDPADLPAADAQAEFWFANRLSREHDEFVQNRARQMARFARLGGHPFASHWASLADRWTRLCKPTVNNLSSEMGPFAFEVIPNELLFGEAGDPAEIQFTLEVSPRAGVPFSETFVRILDANQLNVEPKKLTLTDGYELKTGGEPQKIAITLQKPKNVTLPESTITIALIDKATLMPWDVRRLTLRTPLKDQDWRIEFRAKGELADRNDPSARDRNKDDKTSDRYRTVLWLPAKPRDEKPLSLQPVLIPPPNSKTKFVSVKVFELDEKGAPRPTPSGQKDKLPLSRDGLPMELNLAAAPVAPVAPAAAATNPKPTTTPAPSPAGREVSRGWLFEILPDGEPAPVKQYVVPRVRGPNAYFNLATKIQVEFLDGVLSYKLQRRSDEEELDQALRPESVRVKLDLPPTLKVLKPEYQLGWNFRRSESNILVAQFDKNVWQKLDQTFLVSLIVNDWPRAFPFEVRHGATAVPARPRVPRIVAPADGSVFSVGKKLPIDIEIESEQLDLFGLDKPWKLTCELVPNNAQAIPPRPLVIEIFRSLHESIELVSQGETEWLLTAEVRNHRVEFDTQDLKGRFFVRVTASRLGDKVFPQGGGESEKVRIAIADPNTLPPQPKLTVTSLPKIRLGSEDDVEVPISAADSEAGIKEIAVGFANKEGKLGDNEIIKEATRSWINPLDEVERRVTLRIPAARLQDKSSGKHRLLVIAKNGVDKDCKDPLVVNLEVDQARGWVVVQVPKGCVLLFNGKEQITAGGEWRDELPIGEHEFQLVGDIVKTRKGTQKKLTVKIENTKDKPALVTLEPPAK